MRHYQSTTRPYATKTSTLTHGSRSAIAATLAHVSPATWGVALVEAAIGYEWLLSGLNKLLSPDFSSGLAQNLRMSLQGNPNSWYVSLARTLMIPHAQVCAVLAEGGEVLVGLGLFAGAFLWVSGKLPVVPWSRLLNLGVIISLLGGILMSANYAAMAGDTLPGINAGNPFNEGLSIDSLLTIVGIGLLIVHMLASRLHAKTTSDRAAAPYATRRTF